MATADDILGPPKPWEGDPGSFIAQTIGAPVTVTSAHRTAEHNAAVGGVPHSAHLGYDAYDFVPRKGMTTAQAAKALANSGVPFDQIIQEGDHVHVKFSANGAGRGQIMGRLQKPPLRGADALLGPPPTDQVLGPDPTPAPAPAAPVAHPAATPKPSKMANYGENLREEQASAGEGFAQAGKTLSAENLQGRDPVGILGQEALGVGQGVMAGMQYLSSPVSAAFDTGPGQAVETATKNAPHGKVAGVDYDLRFPKTFVGDAALNIGGVMLGGGERPALREGAAATEARKPFTEHSLNPDKTYMTAPAPRDGTVKGASEIRQSAPPPVDEVLGEKPARAIAASETPETDEVFSSYQPGDAPEVGSPNHAGPVVGGETEPVERVDNAIYRLGGHATADKLEAEKFLDSVPKELFNPHIQAELGHEIEQQIVDPGHEIPERLKPAYEAFAKYRDEVRERTNRLREMKDPEVEPFLEETGHTPRRAVGHTPIFDAVNDPTAEPKDPILGKRNLSTDASSLHSRTAGWVVTDAEGNQHFMGDKPTPEDVGKEGQPFTNVRQATMQEIEANTDIRYYNNPLINTVDEALRLRRVERNIQVLEELKENLKNDDLAHHDEWHYKNDQGQWVRQRGNTERPPGFVTLDHIPQLKGWSFDPQIAEVLKDYYPEAEEPIDQVLGKINRLLIGSLFITPVPHALNVGAHWVTGRGWDWWPSKERQFFKTTGQAMSEVWNKGPKYRQMLREGTGLMYGDTQVRNFHQLMLEKAGAEIVGDPETWKQFQQAFRLDNLGVHTAKDFVRLLYRSSNKAMWLANDVFLMQRVLELEEKGMSVRAATKEAEKDIPNYRIPSRVMGSRTMASVMKDRKWVVFGRYKYGQWKALSGMFEDLLGPKATMEERKDALGKFVVTALIMGGIAPLADKLLQMATHNKDARARRPGPFAILDAIAQYAKGEKDWATAASSMGSPAPLITTGVSLWENRNFFGRPNFQAVTPLGAGVQGLEFLAGPVYPLQVAEDFAHPGGGARAAGRMFGLDIPPEGTRAKRAAYRLKDIAQAEKREAKDPIQRAIQKAIDAAQGRKAASGPTPDDTLEDAPLDPADKMLGPIP